MYLVTLRDLEEVQEDVLRSAAWGRVARTVADALGAGFVDRRDSPEFTCGCGRSHRLPLRQRVAVPAPS
jgi:hypothetical protein